MTESASALHRKMTADRITTCAQDLAEERGLDGFTMDDVAVCAGVSRRTLFNYVSGKYDAVLGAPPAPDPANFVEFRAGGPTGRLADDLKATVAAVLERKNPGPSEMERVRRLIASDARLNKALRDKFARLAAFFAEAICEREGETFDAYRAQAVATMTLSLFDVALAAFVEDPSTSLADYYLTAFDSIAALFD